eukprot:gene11166-23334_t
MRMISTVFFLAALTALASRTLAIKDATKGGKTRPIKGCPLDIYMMDKWGDGWNGAKLFVTSESGTTGSLAPKAFGKSKSYSPKPLTSGTSVSVVLSPLVPSVISISSKKSEATKEFWEIWWSFSVDGTPYIGGYETEVTLMCLWQSPSDYVIQVVEIKNAEEPSCKRCHKPKPKPKPKASQIVSDNHGGFNVVISGSGGGSGSDEVYPYNATLYNQTEMSFDQLLAAEALESALEAEDDLDDVMVESGLSGVGQGVLTTLSRRNLDGDSKPKPKPRKPYPYITMLMNTAGSGWFDGTGTSTYYSISDSTRYELMASGTICGEFSKEICEEKLPDGSYIFRVSGNGDANQDDNSWKFCGVTGGPQQELSFSVKKGKCTAGVLRTCKDYRLKNGKTPSGVSGTGSDSGDVAIEMDDDYVEGQNEEDEYGDEESLSGEENMSQSASPSSSADLAQRMLFISSAVGSFLVGFLAIGGLVLYRIKSLSPKMNVDISDIATDKLLAANGLTIIKEQELGSSRHKLVAALDL